MSSLGSVLVHRPLTVLLALALAGYHCWAQQPSPSTLPQSPSVLLTRPENARSSSSKSKVEAQSLQFLSPRGGTTVSGIVNLKVRTLAVSNLAEVKLWVDGAECGSWNRSSESIFEVNWDTSLYRNGRHKVTVVARDNLGKSSSNDIELDVKNDLVLTSDAKTNATASISQSAANEIAGTPSESPTGGFVSVTTTGEGAMRQATSNGFATKSVPQHIAEDPPPFSITANIWTPVSPAFSGAPDGGQLYPQGWANKGTYDPATHRAIFSERWYDDVRGGSIFANGIHAYDPVTNTFSTLKLNNWYANEILCPDGSAGCYTTSPLPANSTDPTPPDHHPLGGVELVPSQNAVYTVNGVNSYLLDTSILNATWKLDLGTDTWTQVSTATSDPNYPPNNGGSPSGLIYDSSVGKLVQLVPSSCGCNGTATYLFDPQTNLWSALIQDSTSSSVYVAGAAVAYDSKRGRLLTLGGNNYITVDPTTSTWAYSASQNQWTKLADAPVASMAAAMAYDSNHDVFLALIGNNTYVYDPSSNTWSQFPATLYRPAELQQWQALAYDEADDVFVFEGGTFDSPLIALFRYDPSQVPSLVFDRTPPTVSISSPSSDATVSGVTPITAVASDQLIPNSTNTVGMLGVQFQLDGTDIGGIIAGQGPEYTYNWNTSNFQSGPHTITAVAIDAVENVATVSIPVTIANEGTPPVISAVSAKSAISSQLTITWLTNEPADSQVSYGLTGSYGSSSQLGTSLVTKHAVILSGLLPLTTYHFMVMSRDSSGNLATSSDYAFTTSQASPPLLEIMGNNTEAMGSVNGSLIVPTISPSGFYGLVAITGTGSVNFVPTNKGVYFLNCCDNTNDGYYRFTGSKIGGIFNAGQGQISFALTSRYSFQDRESLATSPRYVFDVRDDDPNDHLFSFFTEADSGRLVFAYQAGSPTTQFYFVPQGTEETIFGNGVTLRVTLVWDGSMSQLFLNDSLVQSSAYSSSSPNWSNASVFDLGAFEYATYGGFNSSDDGISNFSVFGPIVEATPDRPERPQRP